MACLDYCCVLVRGEFFISDWGSECLGGIPDIICESMPSAFKKVGNVSSANIQVSSSVLGRENKFNPMEDACSRIAIEGVQLDITFSCASSSNLYRALFSSIKEVATGTDIKDFCISSLGECDFFPFNKPGSTNIGLGVYLRDSLGDLVKELIEDTDFKYSKSGIEILIDIDIEDATILRLEYDYDTEGFHEIDLLSQYMGYKTIYFRGTNYNDELGKSFDMEIHKVLFKPIDQFDVITKDDFLTITLSGTVEKCKSKDTWFKITKEEG